MDNEALQAIAEDIELLDVEIRNAEELIAVARDAGEDVTSLKSRLNIMKKKQSKWKDSLRKHGYYK